MRASHILSLALLLSAAAWADEAAKAAQAKADELTKTMASKDAEERLSAVREAARNQHKSLVSPLTRLLKDKDVRIRYEAIAVLGLRLVPKDKKTAAKALNARLVPLSKKVQDQEELLKVVSALHDLAQPSSIKPLLDMKADTDRDVAVARAKAVANVPSKEAIERLIQFGYKDRRGASRTVRTANLALTYATGEKVRGGIEGWRKWWSDNKASFDVEAAAEARLKSRMEKAAKDAKKEERKRRKRKKKDGA
ncbi:MAG: HEAT repeat domain-containing protein [Planctomycetota bacterium]|jgi:HEAT repeat protein